MDVLSSQMECVLTVIPAGCSEWGSSRRWRRYFYSTRREIKIVTTRPVAVVDLEYRTRCVSCFAYKTISATSDKTAAHVFNTMGWRVGQSGLLCPDCASEDE